MLAACAVNDKGLVSVRYFENDSSFLLIRESWGCYLSTQQTNSGLTLGHTERIMIFPKPGNESVLSIDQLLEQSTSQTFDREIETKDANLKNIQPYAWIVKNQGVMLHANSIKTGISVGMESHSAIRLPADFDGFFMFGYRSDGTVEAVIHETAKNE